MKILSIETSCDESSIALIETLSKQNFKVYDHIVLSQAQKHAEFGGVYPTLAKREHAKNLPVILQNLKAPKKPFTLTSEQEKHLQKILQKEPELIEAFKSFKELPETDAIAVTAGPGLAPSLWIGVNFANALSFLTGKPLIPVNHMEGHIISGLLKKTKENEFEITSPPLPAIAFLISGGHTQIVLVESLGNYKILAETKDDAVGEAYDKVARMLGLPYPGGPQISALADQARKENLKPNFSFPRPMIKDPGMEFSFSGLKTAVRYFIQDLQNKGRLSEKDKKLIAYEFEEAVKDVFISKLKKALQSTGAKALIIGGGVSANKYLMESIEKEFSQVKIFPSLPELTGDNALMMAAAALVGEKPSLNSLQALANWRVDTSYTEAIKQN